MEHEEQADRLEREADKLEQESDRVSDRIEETRGDWESKEQDVAVPGAQPELDEALLPEDEDDPEADDADEAEAEG